MCSKTLTPEFKSACRTPRVYLPGLTRPPPGSSTPPKNPCGRPNSRPSTYWAFEPAALRISAAFLALRTSRSDELTIATLPVRW
ncbi:Uncharacterised protein [Mycobacteroides abscessus subsp. abscessus]|nr:Uncharacterised protein [Mycobacteroides abscessus subsp. abscessus]